jgi:hypothetical protein
MRSTEPKTIVHDYKSRSISAEKYGARDFTTSYYGSPLKATSSYQSPMRSYSAYGGRRANNFDSPIRHSSPIR